MYYFDTGTVCIVIWSKVVPLSLHTLILFSLLVMTVFPQCMLGNHLPLVWGWVLHFFEEVLRYLGLLPEAQGVLKETQRGFHY